MRAPLPRRRLRRRGRTTDPVQVLDSLRETNLGERAANERAQSEETAMEHGARAAADSHVPGSENLERQNRGVEQVSQLVCEEFQSVGAPRRCDIHGGLIPLTSIFGDRPGNRFVEASLRTQKSALLITALISVASSVTDWHTSP